MNIYEELSERLVVLCDEKYKCLSDLIVCVGLDGREVNVIALLQIDSGNIWYEFTNDFYEGESEVELFGFTAVENVKMKIKIEEKIL